MFVILYISSFHCLNTDTVCSFITADGHLFMQAYIFCSDLGGLQVMALAERFFEDTRHHIHQSRPFSIDMGYINKEMHSYVVEAFAKEWGSDIWCV